MVKLIGRIKPKKVTIALILLWTSFIAFVLEVIIVSLFVPPSHFKLAISKTTETIIQLTGWIFMIVFFIFLIFLILMISKGKNWARITYLILFILSIPYNILQSLSVLLEVPYLIIVSVLYFATSIIGLGLLFTKQSNNWFN